MVVLKALRPAICFTSSSYDGGRLAPEDKVRFVKFPLPALSLSLRLSSGNNAKLILVQATEESFMRITNDEAASISGEYLHQIATNGKTTNIVWHKSPIGKFNRQELLQQKGCIIWITGLSGSGKSTLACALCHALHARGKLAYILDGDNVRHGLNRDLSFKAEDRAENIRRIGIICVASVISPYRKDRDACRALLPEGNFIEVFMNVPLQICEARDPKGLYKLARAGKIKGFTGIDDPYEPPLSCELELPQKGNICASPCEMADNVISYLEEKGYLQA